MPTRASAPLGEADGLLSRKLSDLALLLDAWDEALRTRDLGSERLMAEVADRIEESRVLRGDETKGRDKGT